MALIAMCVYDTEENQRSEYTNKTLQSLAQRVDFRKHRLIVVDNSSCQKAKDIIRYWQNIFEFEVITTTGAHSFQIPHTLDHRKFRKDLKKFIKCDDVTLVVYTTVDSKGNMLKDRKFCTNIKDIKI